MGAFELVHTIRFESARRLTKLPPEHRCSALYGLAFHLDIHVVGPLQPSGFVIDFAEIESAFAPLYHQRDHHYRNGIAGLQNPTTEGLLAWIWTQLAPELTGLTQLTRRENDVSRVVYRGG